MGSEIREKVKSIIEENNPCDLSLWPKHMVYYRSALTWESFTVFGKCGTVGLDLNYHGFVELNQTLHFPLIFVIIMLILQQTSHMTLVVPHIHFAILLIKTSLEPNIGQDKILHSWLAYVNNH